MTDRFRIGLALPGQKARPDKRSPADRLPFAPLPATVACDRLLRA